MRSSLRQPRIALPGIAYELNLHATLLLAKFRAVPSFLRASIAGLLGLLALHPSHTAAQQLTDYRESSSLMVVPGLKRGVYSFQLRGQAVQVQNVSVQLSERMLHVEELLAREGPNQASHLETLATDANVLAIVGIEMEPPIGKPSPLRGLRLVEDRLYSWPAEGLHLVLQHEGAAEFVTPPRGAASARLDDGTSITIASVNGALPPPGEGAAVYTGELTGQDLVVARWPEDTIVVVMRPEEREGEPHALLLPSDYERNRRFIPDRIVPRAAMKLGQREAALVLLPPLDPDLKRKLERRMALTVTVDLDPRTRLAKAVLPVPGRVFLRDGRVEPGTEFDRVRNVLALNDSGDRMMAITTNTIAAGVPVETLAPFLAEEAMTQAIALDERAPLLLADVSLRREYRDAALAPVRTALGFREGSTEVVMAGSDGNLVRLAGFIPEGTRQEFPLNAAARATDLRAGTSPNLNQFWATTVDPQLDVFSAQPGTAPWRLRLHSSRPQRVTALELVHAEAAGFSPQFNLKAYRVVGRASAQDSWKELQTVRHAEPLRRERLRFAGDPPLSDILIEILEPSFVPQGDVARIAEVIVWGPAPEEDKRR